MAEPEKHATPRANEPRSKSSLWLGLLLTVVCVPAIFWMQFGVVDGFAFAVAGFFVLLQLGIVLVPKKAAELGPDATPKIAPGRFDFLGVVWLLAIPFAPVLGWAATNVVDVDADDWRAVLGVRAFVSVILPVVCVLPLVRYVRGRAAGFAAAILVIGTAFPLLTGAGAAYDVVVGPAEENVVVADLQGVAFSTATGGGRVDIPDAFVILADGRRLTHAKNVAVKKGAARIVVLRGFGRILAATYS